MSLHKLSLNVRVVRPVAAYLMQLFTWQTAKNAYIVFVKAA